MFISCLYASFLIRSRSPSLTLKFTHSIVSPLYFYFFFDFFNKIII
jgi:hypothetical protein